METLDKKYLSRLEELKNSIQNSELLATYLDEEEEEQFKELAKEFEPQIEAIHIDVAENDPLQIVNFEKELLATEFEGLFLPRVLGYSVMRNDVNAFFKYALPQDHFKDVLHAICNCLNFEALKSRIGQSIQVGFALSSDIWITNFMNTIANPKVAAFLESFRLAKFRDIRDRHTAFVRFGKQFTSFNYQSASFPENLSELKVMANALKTFLIYRAQSGLNNDNLEPQVSAFLRKEEFVGENEFTELLIVVAMSFDLNDKDIKHVSGLFDKLRAEDDRFQEKFFEIILKYLTDPKIVMGTDQDTRLSKVLNLSIDDDISAYYKLMKVVHGLGYIHEDSLEAVRAYYDNYKGLSIQNECVRQVIRTYFAKVMHNIEPVAYADYFELNKTFIQYINIFSNEKFNQEVKGLSLSYVKKLIKHFTDKRGRDYQDIKKFVNATFTDLGFMKKKDLVELFKTKRKPTPAK